MAAEAPAAKEPVELNLVGQCERDLLGFPGPKTPALVAAACAKTVHAAECVSAEGTPIYHYDKAGVSKEPKKVLVFSLIHGDETPAGSVGRYWMERLETIDPRNSWRVVPVLNPDGVKRKTRTNANKIDLNRNFPTKDWSESALALWRSKTSSNPRRYPGEVGGSEPEVKCALHHIEEFKPDFIVSIHTPLRVLDFDGPNLKKKPNFDYLPWKSLGTFPGSLGRYMWFERQTPVLTMELEDQLPGSYRPFESLQDIIGSLTALESSSEAPPPPPSQSPSPSRIPSRPSKPAQ
ncbi:MAG: DUF2817 domain-containing protein [Bdellovibrionaceae bacterium]|nr:DUF2817 domain-containing protein [Pseudobdellovibrionaceae bacterium]